MHINPVVYMGDQKCKLFKILVSASKGKKLVRLRLKWEVNIKMGIRAVCFEHVKLICPVKDRIH
jgi:hypothetical protein